MYGQQNLKVHTFSTQNVPRRSVQGSLTDSGYMAPTVLTWARQWLHGPDYFFCPNFSKVKFCTTKIVKIAFKPPYSAIVKKILHNHLFLGYLR